MKRLGNLCFALAAVVACCLCPPAWGQSPLSWPPDFMGDNHWRDPVASASALPVGTGNRLGDCRKANDSAAIWCCSPGGSGTTCGLGNGAPAATWQMVGAGGGGGSPTGAAGGGLSGTYPNPSVVATTTPAVAAIPRADGSGKLAVGWIPTLNQSTTGTAAGLSSPLAAGSATSTPLQVVDAGTGPFQAAAHTLSFSANGAEVLRLIGVASPANLLSVTADAADGIVRVSSFDTSGFPHSALSLESLGQRRIYFKANGLNRWSISGNTGNFEDGGGNGGTISINYNTFGATAPGYAFTSDQTTGLGWAGAGKPALIANGVEILEGGGTGVTIKSLLTLNPVASAPAACNGGSEGAVYHNTNHSLCWCNGTAYAALAGPGPC